MNTTVEATGSATVAMDLAGRIRIPKPGAIIAAVLRIGIGLIYLWAFLSQGFGIGYSNQAEGAEGGAADYAWHFGVDGDAGWISSGFTSSPTEGYIGGTDGPLAFILLLLMWLHASNYWGLGRWWRARTPAPLQ
jgi:thiosulfate dehydrogenase (quinone) large subunit